VKHKEQLPYLKKIEGQIRGVQKMVGDKRYCIDILTQLNSIIGAISRVRGKILQTHLEGCVQDALKGKSEMERSRKIAEVIEVVKRCMKI